MKTLKRIFWFAMVLAMVMSLGISALAGNPVSNELDSYDASYTDANGLTITETDGTYTAAAGSTVNITNALLTDVTVVKTWQDDGNRDGVRPSELTIVLMDDGGTEYGTYTLTANDAVENTTDVWAHTFTDLVAYNEKGNKINYTVKELNFASYEIDIGDLKDGEIDVTNTHDSETVTIGVDIVWDDDNNREGMRDDSEIAIFVGDKEVDGTSTGMTPEATHFEWILAKNDANTHQAIEYALEVTDVPDGYTANVSMKEGGGDFDYVVTYTHVPSTVIVDATKIWSESTRGGNAVVDADLVRPSTVRFTLYANYNDGKGSVPINTYDMSSADATTEANDVWNHVFTTDKDDNPLYDYANGKQVTYEIKENKVNGYSTTSNCSNDRSLYQEAGESGAIYKLTMSITNSYTIAKWTEYSVEKVWENVDDAGLLKCPVTIELYRSYDGISNQLCRTVTLDGETEETPWEYTFENLPESINGYTVHYKAVEKTISNKYTTTYDYTDYSAKITNTSNSALIGFTATKVWDDNDNQDGIRPDSVEVTLTATDDNKKVAWTDTQTLSASNGWTYSWSNLSQYSTAGKLLTYTLTEAEVDGYTTDIVKGRVSKTTNIGKITITNSHTPETGSVTIEKEWVDGENANYNVKYELLANNEVVSLADGKGTLNAANNWTETITGLPVYANGAKINYTVRETNVCNGYTATYSDGVNASSVAADSTLTITNTYTPGETNIDVVKVWDDGDDFEGFRPDYVTVHLYANDVDTGSYVVLNETNKWYYNFTGLNVYDTSGKEIVYTVKEDEVANYTTKIDANTNEDKVTGYTITNTHEYTTLTISFTRTWVDNNNQDGVRDSGLVYLHADYQTMPIDAVTIDADTNSGSFTNLPRYVNGEEVTYSVTHTLSGKASSKYMVSVGSFVEDENGNFSVVITDTHTPATITFSGDKFWGDQNNIANKRPESITLKLYAGEVTAESEPIQTKTVYGGSTADAWKFSFDPVAVYENGGEEISYTIIEDAVANYNNGEATEADIDGYLVTVTNEPDFDLYTSITAYAKWSDKDNANGRRPSIVGFTLEVYKNGEWTEAGYATLNAAGNWSATWNDLPVYDNANAGTELVYRVVEAPVTGYSASNDGIATATESYTITNTEIVTSVTVNKTWQDGNDKDGLRPESIGIILYAQSGENAKGQVDSATISEATEWSYTFDNLPVVDSDGNTITYSVIEVDGLVF